MGDGPREPPLENELSEETREAGFGISPDKLASLIHNHDLKALESTRGVEGIAAKLKVSLHEGIKSINIPTRQKIYGFNKYTKEPSRSFWMFVWDALHHSTIVILMVCAIVSFGFQEGMYDRLCFLLSIFLAEMGTAVSDYKLSLEFKDSDKVKHKIFIHVTRDGLRQKVSIFNLVVGDVVHLSIGDQVPADGIFISGYSLAVDESSLLSGESVPVDVSEKKPFLFSGTKVQDGSGKMLVMAVGMRTELGKFMETLSNGGEEETPLQVKLNSVSTVNAIIGLALAVLTLLLILEKGISNELTKWTSSDALSFHNYFKMSVPLVVLIVDVVLGGLPLLVTLSLAFAMKNLMNDKALTRRLSACETMGSATCICTDKYGNLTTNHMVVTKICIGGKLNEINGPDASFTLFQNTGSEVAKGKNGKTSILGSPTESAHLEFGLVLGTGDGTNDAPALHEADIGLSMGIAGTEVDPYVISGWAKEDVPSQVDPLYDIYLISSKDGNGDDADMTFGYPVFHALREKGHLTYKYGHDIESEDVLLIQQLKCCIIFFSKNYVSSRCYLDELVKIAHRFSTSPHRILPIYFNLDKSDIRNQLGILREVFYEYEREIDDEMDYQRKRKLMCDVEKRRAALKQIVDHSPGFHFPNGSESKEDLIKRIVLEAEWTVKRRDFKHPPKPIGIDRRAKSLQSWVDN